MACHHCGVAVTGEFIVLGVLGGILDETDTSAASPKLKPDCTFDITLHSDIQEVYETANLFGLGLDLGGAFEEKMAYNATRHDHSREGRSIMTDIYETISTIRSASPRPIFVFGSNEAGAHGAGAARTARYEYGAKLGVGRGRTGDAYAIPTKDANIQTRPLTAIALDVAVFLNYARAHPELTFQVTRIGCGLAGYTDSQIGPMFAGAPSNCLLPAEWRHG